MRLNEIPNYDGSIWAYAQMAKYAREMHGELHKSTVRGWTSKHGTADDWAQCGYRHNRRRCCSANKHCCKKKKIQTARKKVSGISEKPIKEIDLSDDEITILTDDMLDKNS